MKDRFFIWVNGNRLLLYLARGWKLETVDERYWSVLMSRDGSVPETSPMEEC